MGIIKDNEVANPFRYNYIFSKFDLERVTIKWSQYPLLWILPTYVQLNDGYVFYYKRFSGRIYLIKTKKTKDLGII